MKGPGTSYPDPMSPWQTWRLILCGVEVCKICLETESHFHSLFPLSATVRVEAHVCVCACVSAGVCVRVCMCTGLPHSHYFRLLYNPLQPCPFHLPTPFWQIPPLRGPGEAGLTCARAAGSFLIHLMTVS